MTDRITLTDEERDRLRSCDSTDRIITDQHLAAVESIVAARVAEALRDAAGEAERDAVSCPAGCTSETCKGHNLTTARWLRALANEYDPQEET
jgi:hypothetical protein